MSARFQIAAAIGLLMLAVWTLCAAVQIATGAPLTEGAANRAEVEAMQSKLAAVRADYEAVRRDAAAHAARLERRQALLASILAGKRDPKALVEDAPAAGKPVAANDVTRPLAAVEGRQLALVGQATDAARQRYQSLALMLRRLGINPARFHAAQPQLAMGGPYEPVSATDVSADGDQQFRALFNAYRRLDQIEQGVMSVPSFRPVRDVNFTSGYGVRSDPFRGSAAMHAGIDLAGPMGTPIYAAADGIVGRAQWANGYGNLVELEHGRGIQTRYGHLSAILVHAGERVRRGQLIARMGSTGRSTGSHLHYEVRLDGRAVNPVPFLQSSDYLMAMQQRAQSGQVALGGPEGN